MKNQVQKLYALEQLSGGGTWVHRLHPTVKLLATAAYILCVLSFDPYAFGRLVPYVFFPTLLMAFSETPYVMLLKRFCFALPFALFGGLANLFWDRAAAFTLGGLTLTYGFISLCTILFRSYLCVMALLLLVSVTPLAELTRSLRRLRVPHLFITVFEMTYRYIGLLSEEAYAMFTAYTLRSGGKGIAMRDMGSFVGQLLLRSIDRAERVYGAMQCRGYALKERREQGKAPSGRDLAFAAGTLFFCVLFRVLDIGAVSAALSGGLR